MWSWERYSVFIQAFALGLGTDRQTRHRRDCSLTFNRFSSIYLHYLQPLSSSSACHVLCSILFCVWHLIVYYRSRWLLRTTANDGDGLNVPPQTECYYGLGVELFLRKRKTTTCGVEVLSTSFNLIQTVLVTSSSLQVLECWGFLQYVTVAMPAIIKFPLLH